MALPVKLAIKILQWMCASLIRPKRTIYNFYCSNLTTTTNNSPQHQATWGQQSYVRSTSIPICSRLLSLHTPRKFPFPLNLSLWHPFTPDRGRPAFLLVLDGWPIRTIFGNLSSFIRRTCPNHLTLSFIIALESGIETHFVQTTVWNTISQPGTQNNP